MFPLLLLDEGKLTSMAEGTIIMPGFIYSFKMNEQVIQWFLLSSEDTGVGCGRLEVVHFL